MIRQATEEETDELYQRPLDEFTTARNALAKQSGDNSIKKLDLVFTIFPSRKVLKKN